MSYYNSYENEITVREVIFSIVIAAILFCAGLGISGLIRTTIIDKNKKYETAVQIKNNHQQFHAALMTNYGDVLAEGTLKSVGSVTVGDETGMSVSRRLEEYTKHTRTVSYECGTSEHPKTCHKTEEYWTWDYVRSEQNSVAWITFIDEKFYIGNFPVPREHYSKTVSAGHNLRWVYYKRDLFYYGTAYTFADRKTINNTQFKPGIYLDEAVKSYSTSYCWVYIFWVVWGALIVVCVIGFYALPNHWLNVWGSNRSHNYEW